MFLLMYFWKYLLIFYVTKCHEVWKWWIKKMPALNGFSNSRVNGASSKYPFLYLGRSNPFYWNASFMTVFFYFNFFTNSDNKSNWWDHFKVYRTTLWIINYSFYNSCFVFEHLGSSFFLKNTRTENNN